jgi:cytidylate kinase
MREQVREEPKILAAAEQQMRAWAKSNETDAALDDSIAIEARLKPFVAISREAGAGGSPVGQMVGRMLGWEVLDRDIIDRVAQRYKLSRPLLEMVDETQSNWAYDILGTWLDPKLIPHEKFVVHLGHMVLAAACQASAVYVGRGVQFLLPRDRGLSVRIIASKAYRTRRIAEREGITEKRARLKMLEADNGRRAFVRRFFHHDIDNPHLYDLVLNVERLGPTVTAECIVAAFER